MNEKNSLKQRADSLANRQHRTQEQPDSKWLWHLCATALLALVSTALVGCRTSPGVYSSAFTHFDAAAPGGSTNFLQEGDVVSMTFQYSTNYNSIQKISLDGSLNFSGIGEIKAAGKTQAQLQNELAALYQPLAKDDPITLKTISSVAAVYVAGAVNHPGKILMERPMTVIEAIMEAGGFDPYHAKLSNVSVMRVENGEQKVYGLNLNRMLLGKDPTPFYLKPFDVVQIPSKTFNF